MELMGLPEERRHGDQVCSTDSQLGAPRFARWDRERSADRKHDVGCARACDPPTSRDLTPAQRPACAQRSAWTLKIRVIRVPSRSEDPRDPSYRGGGSVDDGAGFPSTVFGSITSTRVPSGSKRFT